MHPPEPLNDEELTRKDTSYSPGSERETAEKQDAAEAGEPTRPGTGGPDDSGDVEPGLDAGPQDLHLPNDSGPH